MRVANTVDTQSEFRESDGFSESPAYLYDFSINRSIPVADYFDAELMVLAIASGLGAVVAEDRCDVEKAHRLWLVVHTVLDVGAADGRGSFGAQGQLLVAPVLEDVHLLLDDVRGVADSAPEQRYVLKHRRVDPRVAELPTYPFRRVAHVVPPRLLVGEDVLRAAWRLDVWRHGTRIAARGR